MLSVCADAPAAVALAAPASERTELVKSLGCLAETFAAASEFEAGLALDDSPDERDDVESSFELDGAPSLVFV